MLGKKKVTREKAINGKIDLRYWIGKKNAPEKYLVLEFS